MESEYPGELIGIRSMKAHIGVDAKSGCGLVDTAGVTTASVHDAKVMGQSDPRR